MKKISRVTSAVLASMILMSAMPKAKATPAVLAPAMCSTGVGCVLVATVAAGAATYYIWEYGGGKRLMTDTSGVIIGQWDDDQENRHWVFTGGEEACKRMGKKYRFGKLIRFVPGRKPGEGMCIFEGGQRGFN